MTSDQCFLSIRSVPGNTGCLFGPGAFLSFREKKELSCPEVDSLNLFVNKTLRFRSAFDVFRSNLAPTPLLPGVFSFNSGRRACSHSDLESKFRENSNADGPYLFDEQQRRALF